jgi:hypothetical protein
MRPAISNIDVNVFSSIRADTCSMEQHVSSLYLVLSTLLSILPYKSCLQHIHKMELLLNQEQVGLLGAKAQKLLEDAKELYAKAEACADATIKQQEDLNGSTIDVGQRELMVVEQEQELQERKKEVTGMLERGRDELLSREADLNTREATLEAEQNRMRELLMDLLARELAANLQANHLAFREKKLVDKEKRLAEKQLQELATACKRLEEL